MSLADKLKNKTQDNTKAPEVKNPDEQKTASAIEAKSAHILALEKGLRIFKKERLNMLVLSSGQPVKPTPEGFFIALNPEIEKQLDYYAENTYGMVEEVKDESKQ